MNDNSIGLLDFLLALKRYRWLIALFAAAGILLGWARSGDQPIRYDSTIQLGWIAGQQGQAESLEVTDDIKRRVELAIEPPLIAEFSAREGVDERYLRLAVTNERDNRFVALSTRAPDGQVELQRRYHQAVLDAILEEQLRRFEWERQRYDREWGAQNERLEALSEDGGSRIETQRLEALAKAAHARWEAFGDVGPGEVEVLVADREERIGRLLRMAQIRGLDEENLEANRHRLNPALYRRLHDLIVERDETRAQARRARDEWEAERQGLYAKWKAAELAVQRAAADHQAKVREQKRIVDTYESGAQLFTKPRIMVVAKPSKIVGGKPTMLVVVLGAMLGVMLGSLVAFGLTLYHGLMRMTTVRG